MGRNKTDSLTVYDALRLELRQLMGKAIVPGETRSGTIEWRSGAIIKFESYLDESNSYIRLLYTITSADGEQKFIDSFIQIVSMPSNLGKGVIYFFICPENGYKCRILYKTHNSDTWKSRSAYHPRIYYPYQLSSIYNYYNDRYWATKGEVEHLYSRQVKSHYGGHPTALQTRIKRLEDKLEKYDDLRWSIMPVGVQKMLAHFVLN